MKRPGHRPALINDNGVERPYDPTIDEDVPASWLGPLPADLTDPPDNVLDPIHDLPRAAAHQGASDA